MQLLSWTLPGASDGMHECWTAYDVCCGDGHEFRRAQTSKMVSQTVSRNERCYDRRPSPTGWVWIGRYQFGL